MCQSDFDFDFVITSMVVVCGGILLEFNVMKGLPDIFVHTH